MPEAIPELCVTPITAGGSAGASLAAQGAAASLAVHVAALAVLTLSGRLTAPLHVASRGGPSSVEAAWSPASAGELLGEQFAEIPLESDQPHIFEATPLEVAEVTPEAPLPQASDVIEPVPPLLVDPLLVDSQLSEQFDEPARTPTSPPAPSAPALPPIDSVASQSSAGSSGQSGNEGTTDPQFAANAPIAYPSDAVRARLQGTVLLRLHIDADGRVAEVQIVESSGHAILDHAAADGVKSWRAEPARLLGRPVAATALLPVRFRLD